MGNDVQKCLDEYNDGAYPYLSRSELEQLIDSLEDALVITKRKLRDIEKYE